MNHASDRGLSLLELVMAMAVFALVAVMGAQSLTGAIAVRDKLHSAGDRTGQLGRTLALLRRDLGDAVPAVFAPPGGGLRSAMVAVPGRLELSVSGQATEAAPGGAARHRVVWTLDPASGRLERTSWPTLDPADGAQAPEPVPFLDGVRAMTVSVYLDQAGWLPPAELSPEGAVSGLVPDAGRVVLDLDGIGPVTVTETMR